jgi:ribonuclease-3
MTVKKERPEGGAGPGKADMTADAVVEGFEASLPFVFSDRALLKTVFVHRSYLNEAEGTGLASNERLEFLGDSVLSNAVSRMLYERFPEAPEGELTRMRARLVNKHTLARLARSLKMGACLLLGRGERATGGAENPTILAGAFEALLAAVCMERGFEGASSFIEGIFSPLIDATLKGPVHFDSKPRLQEIAQKVFREAPRYRVVREAGPPHKRTFEVEVIVAGQVMGAGAAGKKKDAEQQAALMALKALKETNKELFEDHADA